MESGFNFEYVATGLFVAALLHTFSVSFLQRLGSRFPSGSFLENLFHLLGEVEVVFGLWAVVLVIYIALMSGMENGVQFLESQNFTEAVFIFVIMTLSATRPVLDLASKFILNVSYRLPIHKNLSFYVCAMVIGPLIGSLITEPAAMTVSALILKKHFFDRRLSDSLRYFTLAGLFVAVSVGGTLTHFAAPPVLMVAGRWEWDSSFMMLHFGWKAVLIVSAIAVLNAAIFKSEIVKIDMNLKVPRNLESPPWLTGLHLMFLCLVVYFSHHMVVFVGLFLFFLGLVTVTKEHQDELKLREACLVGFFLGGLVVLGSSQSWWLEPIVDKLDHYTLYFAATGLTGIVDNAALTYLGAQIPGLSDATKYFLVAGSVTGGGLTVIANAPNPVGYGILGSTFCERGIEPLKLFLYALLPTFVAVLGFLLLP